ncbi:RNA polymerase, sigma-24 subunit, ECF subfamily [Candidatus Sulfopaludibacter sp. SbA4]|nr:RNA polymerase, sigma-24 subunit, ECF subfamily [Candidatus Sulfopaludibacter sp. SbA4]
MDTTPSAGLVTQLLHASSQGNRAAEDELIPLVYAELRRLAASYMRLERPDHTLQPTALVHEAYLRLVGQESSWQNRTHFLGVAAQQMRRILVDHARKHKAAKRAGKESRVSFEDVLAVALEQPGHVVEIDAALDQLAKEFPRQARVVELRFFGGYTEDDIAKVLAVSPETVKRDWRFAKTWLSREMRKEP